MTGIRFGRKSAAAYGAALLLSTAGCQAPEALLESLGGKGRPEARLEWTALPPWGSFDDVEGQLLHAAPDSYAVAFLIHVDGWWTKPNFDERLTPIAADGTWQVDYTTGGADHEATRLAAFLVPADFAAPKAEGAARVPDAIRAAAIDSLVAVREAPVRRLVFSGYEWRVRASSVPLGPGPNNFTDHEENIWVDDEGRLHLRVLKREGRWYTAEAISEESFGYGTYRFSVSSRADLLDPQLVAGLFTWDNDPFSNHREIDVELSRWGDADNENAQFVVQPWTNPDNVHRFDIGGLRPTEHQFTWGPERVDFVSFSAAGDTLTTWTYSGEGVPPAGAEQVRINLWLLEGKPPFNNSGGELVVDRFEFVRSD